MVVKILIESTDLNHIKSICYNDPEHTEESFVARLIAVHPVTEHHFRYVEIEIKDMQMFLTSLFIKGKQIGSKIEPSYYSNPLPF
jgi:hypothetical protein